MSVGGTTIEILKSLEKQSLKKWDCPSEIGTVGNYAAWVQSWHAITLAVKINECDGSLPNDLPTQET